MTTPRTGAKPPNEKLNSDRVVLAARPPPQRAGGKAHPPAFQADAPSAAPPKAPTDFTAAAFPAAAFPAAAQTAAGAGAQAAGRLPSGLPEQVRREAEAEGLNGAESGLTGPFYTAQARAYALARLEAAARDRADRKRAGFAMALTAFAVGVPPDDLMHPTRLNATASFARHAAMYLCHVAFSMSLARVAAAFRRDRSTVSHACHRMEDRREDGCFDAWMEALERSARHAHVELAGELS